MRLHHSVSATATASRVACSRETTRARGRRRHLAAVRKVYDHDSKTVFDLQEGPLARFRVFASDSEDSYLYHNIHHVLVDAWTCEKVVDAVLKEYHGSPWRDTMDRSWGSLTTAWRSEPRRDVALADWKLKLSAITTFDTYGWPPGNADTVARDSGSTSVFRIPMELLSKLRLELNGNVLSLFVALLSAFQVLLHQLVPSPHHARPHAK
jgi:Condensation domain